MPAILEISDNLMRDNISRSLADVFKTMLGKDFDLVGPTPCGPDTWPLVQPKNPADAPPQIVGTVGFLGDLSGLMYLYFDVGFANLATSVLLGLTLPEVQEAGDECVNDAVGELTNMILGSFKTGLSDAGYSCRLTIPSILRGRNFSVGAVSAAARHLYGFGCKGHQIVTDILMSQDQ